MGRPFQVPGEAGDAPTLWLPLNSWIKGNKEKLQRVSPTQQESERVGGSLTFKDPFELVILLLPLPYPHPEGTPFETIH